VYFVFKIQNTMCFLYLKYIVKVFYTALLDYDLTFPVFQRNNVLEIQTADSSFKGQTSSHSRYVT